MPIVSGGGGGNSTAQVAASGKVLPVANATGVTVDSTTYADALKGGGAKLTALVFPTAQGAVALALSGDTFPRAILCGDPYNDALFYIGDGSFEPTTGGASVSYSNGDIFIAPTTGAGNYVHCSGAVFLAVAAPGANHAPQLGQVSPKFTITSGALPTVQFVSGTGAQILTTRDAETVTPCTFNPGAATTATVTVELSPNNVTYSTLAVVTEPAGVALDGTILPVKVRVPAGWYLRLTANAQAVLGLTTYY